MGLDRVQLGKNEEISDVFEPKVFSKILFEKMKKINPAIEDMELFEFEYALENMIPKSGWERVEIPEKETIEQLITDINYFTSIQLKPELNGKRVMDDQVKHLSQQLFIGLVRGKYDYEWLLDHFFFDIRGFYFLHRTQYMNDKSKAWLGDRPYKQFEKKQSSLLSVSGIGYKAFKNVNMEVDNCVIGVIRQIFDHHDTPLLIALAGQTAAGKTEIVSRLTDLFENNGLSVTAVEMDHFLTDREEREIKGIDSLGREALHFDLFVKTLEDLRLGKKVRTPKYDFVDATSSHTNSGALKPGRTMNEIQPADIIFIEGNFPFLYEDVLKIIDIKIVYLTDDEIRLKRKWKRDIDYRKKYELYYFLNRYFREQYIMAVNAYTPQLEMCDIFVDTTNAQIWINPDFYKTWLA